METKAAKRRVSHHCSHEIANIVALWQEQEDMIPSPLVETLVSSSVGLSLLSLPAVSLPLEMWRSGTEVSLPPVLVSSMRMPIFRSAS